MNCTDVSRPLLTTWGRVLEALPSWQRSDMVCFGAGPESAYDECLVVDSNDLVDGDDVPAEAAELGWNTTLLKDEIQDIVSNLRQQVGEAGQSLTLRAIEHYVDNDAFLTAH